MNRHSTSSLSNVAAQRQTLRIALLSIIVGLLFILYLTRFNRASVGGDDESVELYGPLTDRILSHSDIADLLRNHELTKQKHYHALRKYVARHFIRAHDAEIRKGLASDYDAMMHWADSNPGLLEELCVAIDEEHDDIPGAFSILDALRKSLPDEVVRYKNLAIATALVWDDGDRSGMSFLNKSVRQAKAKYDHSTDVSAVENFRFLVENEDFTQGRLVLPWEILIYVVNQRTPNSERQWVFQEYSEDERKRQNTFFKVPYDSKMRDTRFKVCKLKNKDYTLPNIRAVGGVCVQQADFASRVNKTLAIASFPVKGRSSQLDAHEWVSWIEVRKPSSNTFTYEIQTQGRYKNGFYYRGRMQDAQTGRNLSDRDFENDVKVLAENVHAKRQAELALRAFQANEEVNRLDVNERIALLEDIIVSCPRNRRTWSFLADVVVNHHGNDMASTKIVELMNRLGDSFNDCPDFIWEQSENLLKCVDDVTIRTGVYQDLVTKFENADRPDLSYEARLAISDCLLKRGLVQEAIESLESWITKYSNDGRYGLKILDRIDEICSASSHPRTFLVPLYNSLLPNITTIRNKKPLVYAKRVYERAVQVYSDNGEAKLASEASEVLKSLQ